MKLSPIAIALSPLMALTAAPAFAEVTEALSPDTIAIERMIVTGSRVPERLDEVPSSVTLIDSKTLATEMSISSELQNMLATRVPGMSPATGTSSNAGQTLRGRKALILIDGVPQSTPLRNGSLDIRSIDMNAIERVEVIKGATSIYGNGAAGGIINYITKKPGADGAIGGTLGVSTRFSAVKFEDSVGSRVEGALNGSVGELGYLISASRDDYGLQRDAEGDVPGLVYGLSETTTDNLFTKFHFNFDDEKSLQLTYNYFSSAQDARMVDVTGSVNTGEKTYAIEAGPDTLILGEPQGVDGNHNLMVKYEDLALFDNTRFAIDAYGQKIENVFFYSLTLANPEQGFDGGQSIIRSEKRGLRANFNSDFTLGDTELDLIYGIDYLQDISSQPLVDGRMWVPEMDMQNLAFYLQAKWLFAEDWVLKAGVRRDQMAIEVDDYQTLRLCRTATQCSTPVAVKGGELEFDANTYNIGLRYKGSSVFSPFISFSQGADVSDLGLLLRTATVDDLAKIQSQAALIDNYEAGFDGHWEAFSYSAAVFLSKSELGTRTVLNPASGIYEPVRAPQEIKGVELAASYDVNDELTLGANYSWMEGKDTDQDIYLDGQAITPPKFAAYLDWATTDNSSVSLTWLHVGDRKRFEPVNGQYTGSQGPVDSYSLLNLAGNYRIDQLLFTLGVENLLNEDYYSARSQAFTFPGYNTKGLGTTVNLGMKWTF
ncbi:TonB-dependent receptor [Shewanella zhangzhouensis]|uniref:TonB-dependent receptor n=1 Tax=Shewanella zhangzhouensis TaxID=2864213 RepID=UPI001C65FDDA|nr:TonB-dependent receptor [Shewanella zhangzhouensis]QYK06646.1 TonB-dependent receptor [Shewanella zhangzhouensis]